MRRRERSALIDSFQQHYGDLLRFLVRRTGNAQRAADVAQETYLRLSAFAEGGAAIEDHRGYVFRVAGNLAIDTLRRDNRIAARTASTEEAAPLADPAPLPEAVVLGRERLRLLDRALGRLSPNVRRALLMSRLEGRSFAEIAAELGVSESMVSKYIAQALRACRHELTQAEEGK